MRAVSRDKRSRNTPTGWFAGRLGLFLALALAPAPALALAQSMTQANLVAMFDKVCLQTGAGPAAVAAAVARIGLKQSGASQWSDQTTAINVHLFTQDKASGFAVIKTGELVDNGWDNVRVGIAGMAGYKGKGTGCAVSAFDVPIDGLAGTLARTAAKYGGQMKAKSKGRVGSATLQLGGQRMHLTSRPLKVSSGVNFAFLSVARSR